MASKNSLPFSSPYKVSWVFRYLAISNIRISILGVVAILAALFVFINIVPFEYWPNWPIPKCTSSKVNTIPSPSKAMVGSYGRTDCYSKGDLEVAVWVGNPDDSKRQLVFSAPAHFRDRSGVQQPVEIRVSWKSEDSLEIRYPEAVAPNRTVEVFRGERLMVRVMAVSEKLTSNRLLKFARTS